jgi:hypothetical protein
MGRRASAGLMDVYANQNGWGLPPLVGHQFFIPTPAFWAWFDQPAWKERGWVEAGAGLGAITDEATRRGFNMMGVDINEREGQSKSVVGLNALSLPYNTHIWALVCRPDHSGWCELLIEKVTRAGGTVLYVGLDRNVERDLGDYFDQAEQLARQVGEEGEHVWRIGPAIQS